MKLMTITDPINGERREVRPRIPCPGCDRFARWSARHGLYLCKRCGAGTIVSRRASERKESRP